MSLCTSYIFFFNDTSTTEIYTLSLHDALPILSQSVTLGIISNVEMIMPRLFGTFGRFRLDGEDVGALVRWIGHDAKRPRSEEHTSELQSHLNLVCPLLLEKKNTCSPSTPHTSS